MEKVVGRIAKLISEVEERMIIGISGHGAAGKTSFANRLLDDETELMRRSSRDVTERGSKVDLVIRSHEQRRIQYKLFMHPYHENFDIIIKNSNEGYVLEKSRGLDL